MKNSDGRKTLSKSELRRIIQESVCADFLNSTPIDPFAIAKGEGLVLVGHDSLQGFDGCLHYRADRRAFFLHFVDCGPDDPRTRYTVGHELGHYFIPAHHKLLLAGKNHGSKVEKLRVDEREMEANRFAAHLLCPSDELMKVARDVTALEIIRVAGHFRISYTAAARRIVEETHKGCAMVFSKDGKIAYALLSDELLALGFPRIASGARLPLNATRAKQTPSFEKSMYVSDWFPRAQSRLVDQAIWEETLSLGPWGQISILVYEAPDEVPEEDDDCDF